MTEIIITIIWMFGGVSLYQIVFASLTSLVVDDNLHVQSLTSKMDALNDFAEKVELDEDIHNQMIVFLQRNYVEMYSKDRMENMLKDLPSAIKEEVNFHIYGKSI